MAAGPREGGMPGRLPAAPRVPKVHYPEGDSGRTLCGRTAGGGTRLAAVPREITCIRCRCSPLLDGVFGNMTHLGH